jgi:hypothetical protein
MAGESAEEHHQKGERLIAATRGLQRVAVAARRAATVTRYLSAVSPAAFGVWLVAFLLLGQLTNVVGLFLLLLIGVVWFGAWVGARTLASTFGAMANGLETLCDRVAAAQMAGGSDWQNVSNEAIQALASLRPSQLSLTGLVSLYRPLRGALDTIGTVRSMSLPVYTYGLISYLILGGLLVMGMLVSVVGVVRMAL